jgi:integrase
MAKVTLVKVSSDASSNVFDVDGIEVSLYWSKDKKEVQALEDIISQAYELIVRNKSSLFVELMQSQLQLKRVSLMLVLYQVYPKEWNEYLYACCLEMLANQISCSIKALTIYATGVDYFVRGIKSKLGIQQVHDKFKLYIKQEMLKAFGACNKERVWHLFHHTTFMTSELDDLLNHSAVENYLAFCYEHFNEKRVLVSYRGMLNYAFYGDETMKTYYLEKLYINHPVSQKIYALNERQTEQIKQWNYNFDDDVWTIYTHLLESVTETRIDFTAFEKQFRIEVKRYVQHLLGNGDKKPQSRVSDIRRFYLCLESLSYSVHSFMELRQFHLQHVKSHMQTEKTENNDDRWGMSTIRGTFTEMKLFLNHLLKKSKTTNPFEKIKFRNTDTYTNKTAYIPEFVIEQIEKVVHELPEPLLHMWVIMMNTGMRSIEARNLQSDCLVMDETGTKIMIRYIPTKNLEKRLAKGLSKFQVIPAKPVIVDCVNKQLEITKELRESSGLNYLFISNRGRNKSIALTSIWGLAMALNKLIEKHQIKDEWGEIYHYHNHQCRKTLTVELLSNGATLEDVANYIGHLSTRTTERHYHDIKLEKLAELDADFFAIMFNEIVEPEVLQDFNEEEKNALLEEIKLGARHTPERNGYCVKHVAFGPCAKNSCTGCRFLITGPQYLPRLYDSYSEQEQHVNELIEHYQIKKIENYENFVEFQRQLNLLKVYRDSILKTEKVAEKAGVSYDKSKRPEID